MKIFYKTPLLLLLLLYQTARSQTYTRGTDNWKFTGAVGITSITPKINLSPSAPRGNAFSFSVGRYISGRKMGVLPVSVGLSYLQSVSELEENTTRMVFNESQLGLPISLDLILYGIPLSKSKRYECRYLTNTLILGFVPSYSFGDNPNLNAFNSSMDVALAFNISKSGGDRSVQGKDTYLAIFWQHDLNKRYTSFSNQNYFKSILGLRLQYTWFRTHKFSNM